MKRLLVLLIVLAGGLAAAAFAVPSNAASVNGVGISQQQLNSDLAAIAHSADYQCYLDAEQAVATGGQTSLPAVDGTGQVVGSGPHATVSTGFAANYLDTEIGHQLVFELAAQRHLHVTSKDLSTAHTGLITEITTVLKDVSGSKFECGSATQTVTAKAVLATMPTSFVNSSVRFDATVSVLEDHLAGVSTQAGLQRYFSAHASEFDTACFTVAEYTSQTDAEAGAAAVAQGTPFAQVAAATSGGGPQGCAMLYAVADELPSSADLLSLPLDTVSSPVTAGSEYLLIEITSRTPTSFAKARTEVGVAAKNAGATKARTVINQAEKTAAISVDQRYGQWQPAHAQILLPTPPSSPDVLNPTADGSTSVAPSSGQTS